MTRTEIKRWAQDEILNGMQVTYSRANEAGRDEAHMQALRTQFDRVVKFLGYSPHSMTYGV